MPVFLLLTVMFPQIPARPTPSLSLGLCSKATLSERSTNILFSAPMCLLFVFLLGEISITSYADDTTLMAESEEELKSLLMRVKEESEKLA